MKSVFKSALVALLLLLPAAGFAKERPPPEERRLYRSFRIGMCTGMSTECLALAPKIEFSPRYVGFSISTAIAWGTAALRVTPLPYKHGEKLSWRPYGYFGAGYVMMAGGYTGGGVGADMLLFKNKRLSLQPSAGISKVGPSSVDGGVWWTAAGQLSIMGAF